MWPDPKARPHCPSPTVVGSVLASGAELAVDELAARVRRLGLEFVGLLLGDLAVGHGLVDPLGSGGHQGIHQSLAIHTLVGCDLGQRLAVLELSLQLVGGQPQGLGRRFHPEVAESSTASVTVTPVGEVLVHELGHALGESGAELVELLVASGDQGVDEGLAVDAVGFGHLSKGLSLLEGDLQVIHRDANRLGRCFELQAADAVHWSVALSGCGVGGGIGRGGGGGGFLLGARDHRRADHRSDHASGGESGGHCCRSEEFATGHLGGPFGYVGSDGFHPTRSSCERAVSRQRVGKESGRRWGGGGEGKCDLDGRSPRWGWNDSHVAMVGLDH